MLPAAHRMRSAADFSETTRRGRKVARGCVVVYAQIPAGAGGDAARVGLIVGKVVGGSVERHRAARRIRAAMAVHVRELAPGTRIVVRALKGADTDAGLTVDLAVALASAVAGART